MKKSIIVAIAITIVIAIYLPIHYYYPFLGIGSTTETFIFCEEGFTQVNDECVLLKPGPLFLNLEQKIEKVVAEAEGDLDKVGQNYGRLAIDSDLFSYEEKLQVIEKQVKELNTPIPFTENVITGKREFEAEEPITFTWKQFGIGYPCPDVAIQVQSKSSDKLFYEHELTRLCQVLDEDVPFLQTWTQDDFPDFPYCSEWGEYVIKVKNTFGKFGTYHEYFCKGASVANDVVD